MVASVKWYSKAFTSLFGGEVNLATHAFYMMLTTSSYVPDQDAHDYKSDVDNEAANGDGYATGGVLLAGVALTYAAGGLLPTLTFTSPSWPGLTKDVRYGVVYDSTPATDATRPLLGYVDFGETLQPRNGTLAVTVNAAGFAKVTVS